MEDNNSIGSITGIATFEWVEIGLGENYERATVHGYYDGDTSVYECDINRVRIGGMKLRQMFDSIQLEPADDDGWIWVEATEDELRITKEKPNDD